MILTWRQKIIMMAGPTVAVGLVVALGLVLVLPTPSARVWGYLIDVGLMTVTLTAELLLGLGKLTFEKVRLTLPPLLLAISSAAQLSLAETALGKAAVILAGFLLVGSYQSHLLTGKTAAEKSVLTGESEQAADSQDLRQAIDKKRFLDSCPGLPQAAFVTDLFAAFFLTSFIFGFDGFYNIPTLLSVPIIGLVWGILAHENLWRFGAKTSDCRLLGGIFGLLGMEIHLGLSFLPVSYLAEAAVAAIVLTVGLQLTRQVIFGIAETRKFRGQALAVIALIILLFLTTKWT